MQNQIDANRQRVVTAEKSKLVTESANDTEYNEVNMWVCANHFFSSDFSIDNNGFVNPPNFICKQRIH